MKILLFGCNGQLGLALKTCLSDTCDLIALARTNHPDTNNGYCGDFSYPEEIIHTIKAVKPDIIINAAAYTDVDGAESNLEHAMLVNSTGPELIAKVAKDIDALLIHYSTDYIFDGTSRGPYMESDPPHPLNNYGFSKLRGEQLISGSSCRHLILRTGGVYAAAGKNFLNKILQQALTKEKIHVVVDQFGSPTHANLLASCTADIICKIHKITPTIENGVFHLTTANYASRFDVARYIVDAGHRYNLPLILHPENIIPVKTYQISAVAKRPSYTVLNTQKIQKTFGIVLPNWEIGIEDTIRSFADSYCKITPTRA